MSNINQKIYASDRLREPDRVFMPDPRMQAYVVLDLRTGQSRQRVIDDQYKAIACFVLHDGVPIDVVIHFETAKNLYLYAWLVYRFYPVAEQQAFASLEFALRERFQDFAAAEKKKHPKAIAPGLKKLLGHAIKEGFVRNQNFSTREHWARIRAKSRYSSQKHQEMKNAGVDSWVEDESEIMVTQEDLDYDWLGDFQKIIPRMRNLYAHGSWHLYPAPVRHTFEMVSELINQLYQK